MLRGDITTDMVGNVICFLTSALSYFEVIEFGPIDGFIAA